jgi:hypothetical protein
LAGAIGFQYRGSGGLRISFLVFSFQFSGKRLRAWPALS